MRRIISIGLASVLLAAPGAGGGPTPDANAATTKLQDAKVKKPFEDEILAAIAKLKHDVAEDWNDDGKPSMKRIVALAGNNEIKRADVDAVVPDLRRDTPSNDPLKPATLKKEVDENAPDRLDKVKVRAIRRGEYGGKIREPGEDFTFTGKKPSWVVVLKD